MTGIHAAARRSVRLAISKVDTILHVGVRLVIIIYDASDTLGYVDYKCGNFWGIVFRESVFVEQFY